MNTYNNLPLVNLDVDDTNEISGVDFIALVDKPAIKKGYQTFSEHEPSKLAFAITSEDRQIISGPLMLADTPIYRKDSEHGEYYCTFSKEAIERIAQRFFKNGFQNNANEMHDPNRQLAGLTLYESFISDSERGISPMKGYEDAPEGSWFGSFKVEDSETWKQIKESGFTGFSVEGIFQYKASDHEEDLTFWNELDKLLTEAGF